MSTSSFSPKNWGWRSWKSSGLNTARSSNIGTCANPCPKPPPIQTGCSSDARDHCCSRAGKLSFGSADGSDMQAKQSPSIRQLFRLDDLKIRVERVEEREQFIYFSKMDRQFLTGPSP